MGYLKIFFRLAGVSAKFTVGMASAFLVFTGNNCRNVALFIDVDLRHLLVFISVRELFCECGPRVCLGHGFFGFRIGLLCPFLEVLEHSAIHFECVIFVQYNGCAYDCRAK